MEGNGAQASQAEAIHPVRWASVWSAYTVWGVLTGIVCFAVLDPIRPGNLVSGLVATLLLLLIMVPLVGKGFDLLLGGGQWDEMVEAVAVGDVPVRPPNRLVIAGVFTFGIVALVAAAVAAHWTQSAGVASGVLIAPASSVYGLFRARPALRAAEPAVLLLVFDRGWWSGPGMRWSEEPDRSAVASALGRPFPTAPPAPAPVRETAGGFRWESSE